MAAILVFTPEADVVAANVRWTSSGMSDVEERLLNEPSASRLKTANESASPLEPGANATYRDSPVLSSAKALEVRRLVSFAYNANGEPGTATMRSFSNLNPETEF